MASFNKFEQFSEDLAEGVHDLNGDTLKVYLSNTAPNASSHATKSDLAEISAGNGYTAGGADTSNATTRSGGTTSVSGTDITWTASSGTIGPFRYAVLYNATPSSPADPLIGWWDYGSSITLQDTETFTVDFGSSQLTVA